MSMIGRPRYISCLIRLWYVDGPPAAWRASVEDPRTGARRAFPDLASLLAFLEAQTALAEGRDERASSASRTETDGGGSR